MRRRDGSLLIHQNYGRPGGLLGETGPQPQRGSEVSILKNWKVLGDHHLKEINMSEYK